MIRPTDLTCAFRATIGVKSTGIRRETQMRSEPRCTTKGGMAGEIRRRGKVAPIHRFFQTLRRTGGTLSNF